MPRARLDVVASAREFFAVDDDWARAVPAIGRSDLAFAAVMEGLGLLTLELARSAGGIQHVTEPVWVQWLAVSTGAVALVARRRWPLTVAILAALHMFVVGVTMPAVMGQLSLQICYFMALFSAMAWAVSRRAAATVAATIVAFMLLWVAWQFALGSGVQEFLDSTDGRTREGWFAPVTAAVALTFIVNILYFAGAVIGGQVAWRSARQRARLLEQTHTIESQAEDLRHRAVVGERLRIARELHDVVGHHISVIGIQAAGARRVLDQDRGAATAALEQIERSSREGVGQMRQLLGTLRAMEANGVGAEPLDARRPEPDVADLPALVAERTAAGLPTAYELVEAPPGSATRLSGPIGLSLYRVAQEALANVVRHSTASAASVTLRVDDGTRPYAEIEVLDDGRPRPGTSGSGMGQLGMRERAASHGGTTEIGPRATGGYRVRVRIPLEGNDA